MAVFCLIGFSNAPAQIASGGSYTLNQAVIANGGGTGNDAVNNNYKIDGTAAQPAAGTFGTGGAYSVRGGFWSPAPLAPSAASASIGGRVVDAGGTGLRNITISLSGGNLLTSRTVRTNSFGYFTFEDVLVGETYVVTVESRKYSFPQPTQVISLMDNVSDIIFYAAWGN